MECKAGSAPDHDVPQRPEEVASVAVSLSQHTYYFNEKIGGCIVWTPHVSCAIDTVEVVLLCEGHHLSVTEPVRELYRASHQLVHHGIERQNDNTECEMSFNMDLPDPATISLPSFYYDTLPIITWRMVGVVTLSDKTVCRSPDKDSHFRVGCVYSPTNGLRPTVVVERRSFLTRYTLQASLDRLVYTSSDAMTLTIKANIPPSHLHHIKLHCAQHVHLEPFVDTRQCIGVSDSAGQLLSCIVLNDVHSDMDGFVNIQKELRLKINSKAAVVVDKAYSHKMITSLAPTMNLCKTGVEYGSIRYCLMLDIIVGKVFPRTVSLKLPFVISDILPPPELLSYIIPAQPPLDKTPSYSDLATKSKDVPIPLASSGTSTPKSRRQPALSGDASHMFLWQDLGDRLTHRYSSESAQTTCTSQPRPHDHAHTISTMCQNSCLSMHSQKVSRVHVRTIFASASSSQASPASSANSTGVGQGMGVAKKFSYEVEEECNDGLPSYEEVEESAWMPWQIVQGVEGRECH